MARFLSLDPLANNFPAWSAYNYVMANPIMLIDPDGRSPEDPDKPTVSKVHVTQKWLEKDTDGNEVERSKSWSYNLTGLNEDVNKTVWMPFGNPKGSKGVRYSYERSAGGTQFSNLSNFEKPKSVGELNELLNLKVQPEPIVEKISNGSGWFNTRSLEGGSDCDNGGRDGTRTVKKVAPALLFFGQLLVEYKMMEYGSPNFGYIFVDPSLFDMNGSLSNDSKQN